MKSFQKLNEDRFFYFSFELSSHISFRPRFHCSVWNEKTLECAKKKETLQGKNLEKSKSAIFYRQFIPRPVCRGRWFRRGYCISEEYLFILWEYVFNWISGQNILRYCGFATFSSMNSLVNRSCEMCIRVKLPYTWPDHRDHKLDLSFSEGKKKNCQTFFWRCGSKICRCRVCKVSAQGRISSPWSSQLGARNMLMVIGVELDWRFERAICVKDE